MSGQLASDYVVRFSRRQRIEHFTIMVLFILLSLTGFPQKFPDAAWSRWWNDALGGVQALRFLHRGAGLLLGALTAVHFSVVIAGVATRRMPLSMVPTRQDFLDAIRTLRYYLRVTDSPARFGRLPLPLLSAVQPRARRRGRRRLIDSAPAPPSASARSAPAPARRR